MRCEGSVEYEMAHGVKLLADCFCAMVWGYLGDLDYLCQFFGFRDTQGALIFAVLLVLLCMHSVFVHRPVQAI